MMNNNYDKLGQALGLSFRPCGCNPAPATKAWRKQIGVNFSSGKRTGKLVKV